MTAWALWAVGLLCAAPYEDVHGRFTLELPAHWTFTPQPGDSGGVLFRREMEGALLLATVRVMPFTQPVALDAFAGRIAAAADQEPGFRLLDQGATTVAGVPAVKRRYVVWINGDRKLSKMVEQRIFLVQRRGFVLQAETLAEAFDGVEKDFTTFFAGFVPAGRPAVAAPAGRPDDARPLVGTWTGGGHILRLGADGTVALDGVSGRFRVDHGVLVLNLVADERIFQFRLAGDRLTLVGATFGDGQVLRRRH